MPAAWPSPTAACSGSGAVWHPQSIPCLLLLVVTASIYCSGCAPIRMVIKSGSLATIAQGVSLPSIGCEKRREKSGSMIRGILFGDGGRTLASPSPNALAASVVVLEARLLTKTITPWPNGWPPLGLHPLSKYASPPCSSFHLAPSLLNMLRQPPKCLMFLRLASRVARRQTTLLAAPKKPTVAS
jgi:hypothetical protein